MADAPQLSEETPATAPVRFIPDDRKQPPPEAAIGLCLSGGGYRAMLFHVGALWRLNECGLLRKLQRISSVSGGSITAGVLAMNWPQLSFDDAGVARALDTALVNPLRALAGRTVDGGSIIGGILLPGTVADKVAKSYDKYLFHGATLQDLPDDRQAPRFVINATNVQTGSLWRFSRPYMGDWQVGLIRSPRLPLARAVAASSAFPPVLSPLTLDVEPGDFDASTKGQLHRDRFVDQVVLSDGGVYDNLGLETVWKNFKTVLVSDGGLKMAPEPEPKEDWARHALRVLDLIDNQVRSLRKRQLIASYEHPPEAADARSGAYWGIRSRFDDYRRGASLTDPLGLSGRDTTHLAQVKTRLKRMPDELQERLINWGYAICDTALRRHCRDVLQRQYGLTVNDPTRLPYPASGL